MLLDANFELVDDGMRFGLCDQCCFGEGDSSEYEVIWVL